MLFILTRAVIISAAVVGAAPLISAAPTPGAIARSSEVSSGSSRIWGKVNDFVSNLSSFVTRVSVPETEPSEVDSFISDILDPRRLSVVFAKDTDEIELVSRNCRAIAMCKRDTEPQPVPVPTPKPMAAPGPERTIVAPDKRGPMPGAAPAPALEPNLAPAPQSEPEEIKARNCRAIAMCK